MFRSYAYLRTFIAGFAAITVVLAMGTISIVQVLAAALGVGLLVITGALWQDEQVHQEYEEILNELKEYQ